MPIDNLENLDVAAMPHEHVIFTDLDGIEGVLVDLNTRKYFRLNETAAFVWRGLEKRLPMEKIAREMATIYDLPLGHAESSVEKLIRNLCAHKLLREC